MQSNIQADMDKAGNKVKKPVDDMKNQVAVNVTPRRAKIVQAYEKFLENKKDEA